MGLEHDYNKKQKARDTSHKEVSLFQHFKEFVMTVGYDEFGGITKYIGGNHNENHYLSNLTVLNNRQKKLYHWRNISGR